MLARALCSNVILTVSELIPNAQVLALFAHEKIESMSERDTFSRSDNCEDLHWALIARVAASGDMAHTTHPNYAGRHES